MTKLRVSRGEDGQIDTVTVVSGDLPAACPDCGDVLLRGVMGYTLMLGQARTQTGQVAALVCARGCGYARPSVEAVPLGDCAA